MRNPLFTAAGFTLALTTVSCSSLHQNAVKQAADAAGVDSIKSIEFSGTGRWYQFGQAPSPELPWPPFAVKAIPLTSITKRPARGCKSAVCRR